MTIDPAPPDTGELQAPLFQAKRFAAKFNPPCIFLEYEDASQKRRVREVKLSRVSPEVDPERLTTKIIRSFPRHLDPTSVKYEQVLKLVKRVLQNMQQQQQQQNGEPRSTPSRGPLLPIPTTAGGSAGLKVEDSDQLSSSTLGITLGGGDGDLSGPVSPARDGSVHVNQRHPDKGRQGQEDKGPQSYDIDSALSELDRELDSSGAGQGSLMGSATSAASLGTIRAAVAKHGAESSALDTGHQAKTRLAQGAPQEADQLVLELEVAGDTDLNKVTDVQLRLAKQKMEQDFVRNQLRPGDEGFEYDKQVEFAAPTQDNDWDESGEEGGEEDDNDSDGGGTEPGGKDPNRSQPSRVAGPLNVVVDEEDEDEDEGYSYGDNPSESPESVRDDVSPRRVAIDTDSDMSLELP